MRQHVFQKLLLASAVAGLSAPSFAASFQVSEHSAAGLGRAFAGEAAMYDDASVIARNPAALTRLGDRPVATIVGTFVMPDVSVEGVSVYGPGTQPDPNNPGQPNPDFTVDQWSAEPIDSFVPVPALYYSHPVTDCVTLGLGAFTWFGLESNYDNDLSMNPVANYSMIKTMTIKPSIGWQVSDNLSIGGGLMFNHIKAHLTSSIDDLYVPLGPGFGPFTNDILNLEGDDWALGYNIGALLDFDRVRFGLSYHSEVDYNLEGESGGSIICDNILAANANGNFCNTDGTARVDLPSIVEGSVYGKIFDNFAVHASVMRTNWSSIQDLVIKLDTGPEAISPIRYENANRYAIGGTYNLSDAIDLRAGFAYDETPSTDDHRTFRIPDSSRRWFSAGGSWAMNEHSAFDLGYTFVKGQTAVVDEELPLGIGFVEGEVTRGNAHIVALQYNHSF